jgi:hypothetical protein
VVVLTLILGTSPAQAKIESPKLVDVVSLEITNKFPRVSVQEVQSNFQSRSIPLWSGNGIDFTVGIVSNQPLIVSTPMACSGTQITSLLSSVRKSFYQVQGLGDGKGRYLLALAPDFGCIWEAISLISKDINSGGVVILENTSNGFVIAHELGHALGLGHSNLIACSDGKIDGEWGASCSAVEYGGTIDLMSNVENSDPLSTYHQWRVGLMTNQQVYQTWKNENIQLYPSDSKIGIKSIFLRDGKSTYWMEYRRTASKNGYRPGLVVYRTDPPPASAIRSPNPDQSTSSQGDLSISTDMWMMNLDDFRYSNGRASGSMTLTAGKSFMTFSSNVKITLSLEGTSETISVSVTRTPDSNPPPKPVLKDPRDWGSVESALIERPYEDLESAIDYFEIKNGNSITRVNSKSLTSWQPTYLNPLSPPADLSTGDLPEGSYRLSVRAVDKWGNVSPWSDEKAVTIDRSFPITSTEFLPSELTPQGIKGLWKGTRDSGVGLCESRVLNDEGFVIESDSAETDPKFEVERTGNSTLRTQVFDCLGNGKSTTLNVKSNLVLPDRARKTGRWVNGERVSGIVPISCRSSCTMSVSVRESFGVILGAGAPDIFLSGRKILKPPSSSSESPRTVLAINIGKSSQLLRISGKSFTFYAVAVFMSKFEESQNILNPRTPDDPTLSDSNQLTLSRLGFSSKDFASPWNVVPINRGTTLLDPSLDLCFGKYESESSRVQRRQVTVFKDASPYAFLSSEVVRYKSASAAQFALQELKAKVELCKAEKGGIDQSGQFVSHQFLDLPNQKTNLGPEANKVFVNTLIGNGAESRNLLGFYQFKGDLMVGIYVVRDGGASFSDAEISRWLQVAGVIEKRITTI